MSHSYSQNHLHIVFSTKDRQKLIEPAMRPKLWSYIAGIGRNHGFLVLANGGMADHVHLLIQLPPVLALAEAISVVKSNFREMDERTWNGVELATRIWGVQCERVEPRHGGTLHCRPGTTSQEENL